MQRELNELCSYTYVTKFWYGVKTSSYLLVALREQAEKDELKCKIVVVFGTLKLTDCCLSCYVVPKKWELL